MAKIDPKEVLALKGELLETILRRFAGDERPIAETSGVVMASLSWQLADTIFALAADRDCGIEILDRCLKCIGTRWDDLASRHAQAPG